MDKIKQILLILLLIAAGGFWALLLAQDKPAPAPQAPQGCLAKDASNHVQIHNSDAVNRKVRKTLFKLSHKLGVDLNPNDVDISKLQKKDCQQEKPPAAPVNEK